MSEERKILPHEPVPGYRTVFLIVVAVALIYAGFVFLGSLF